MSTNSDEINFLPNYQGQKTITGDYQSVVLEALDPDHLTIFDAETVDEDGTWISSTKWVELGEVR